MWAHIRSAWIGADPYILIGSTVVGRLLITPILYSQHGSCRLFRNLMDNMA